MGEASKRKAGVISPTREAYGQAKSAPNGRKRREIMNYDEEDNKEKSDSDDHDDEEEEEDGEDPENRSEDYIDGYEEIEDFSDYGEEDGLLETEVEEKGHAIDDIKLIFKIFLSENDDDEFTRWMSTIHVHCSHEGKVIGRGLGRYVKRDRIRSAFWRDMEGPCQELSKVAFQLFDRYGRLKKEFKDHPIRKGTGVWGSELDLGSFFVIEDLEVDNEWRRKGLGKRIALFLVEKSRSGRREPDFSLVIPGWLTRDIACEIKGKTKLEQREVKFRAQDVATSFWRSLGFRRIGASCCFGLANEPSHAAHRLLSTDDFDPAVEEPELDEGPEDESFVDWSVEPAKESWRLKLLKDRLPLHHAAITLSDSECLEFFSAFQISEKSTDEWGKVDRFSKNVLHIAATEVKVQSVHWLLHTSGTGVTLSFARNVKGNTPLEQLESELETKRTRREHGMMTVDISDNFSGFTAEAIECLAVLRAVKDPTPADYARLKFGCTCGSCIDGFLSPRMKFALLCQAELLHDLLNEEIEDGKMWCMMHDDLFTHVAPDIQRNFATNKSYRQGFTNLFDHVALTLRENKAPTTVNILRTWENASEWPPHTKNFFQRGGSPDSVLNTVFEHTRDEDEWAGDGQHMEVFAEQVNALPECRNDHEFGFVALACGIQNVTRSYG